MMEMNNGSIKTPQPKSSSPPALTALTWGEIMDAEDTKLEELEKQKKQTKDSVEQKEVTEYINDRKEKKVKEIREQKKRIVKVEEMKEKVTEIREQKKRIVKVEVQNKHGQVQQHLSETTMKLPEDKSCHSKNNKILNLLIRNLDYRVDDKRLYKEFLPFGSIISAKVMMENGRSRGFGYVSYSSTREAMAAMTEMDGMILGRRRLYISLSKSREEPKPYPIQTEQRTGSSRPTKTLKIRGSSHRVVPLTHQLTSN